MLSEWYRQTIWVSGIVALLISWFGVTGPTTVLLRTGPGNGYRRWAESPSSGGRSSSPVHNFGKLNVRPHQHSHAKSHGVGSLEHGKAKFRGSSGFDWSAQLVRLRGTTMRFVWWKQQTALASEASTWSTCESLSASSEATTGRLCAWKVGYAT